MIALIDSPLFWWGLVFIGIGLCVRYEQRLARRHDEACADLPRATVHSIESYRHRRDTLHTPPPRGVRQSRQSGRTDDSPTGRSGSPSPAGPRGTAA